MIFKETDGWIFGVSPYTSSPKTQTRRVVNPGDRLTVLQPFGAKTVLRVSGAVRWQTGRSYAVQAGRGKPAIGRIILTDIRHCPIVEDISPEDALAEGFAAPAQFCEVWARLYGRHALRWPCWALTIERIGA